MSEANGRPNGRPTLGNLLTLLAMGGALAAGWVTLAADNSRLKEKVEHTEQRANEDRKVVKEDLKDVKQNVDKINDSVQLILRKLERREARDQERDRVRRPER